MAAHFPPEEYPGAWSRTGVEERLSLWGAIGLQIANFHSGLTQGRELFGGKILMFIFQIGPVPPHAEAWDRKYR